MSIDKMREQFEQHITELCDGFEQAKSALERWEDGYRSEEAQREWGTWQASRAALVVDLDRAREAAEHDYAGNEGLVLFECIEALEAAGVKVKS